MLDDLDGNAHSSKAVRKRYRFSVEIRLLKLDIRRELFEPHGVDAHIPSDRNIDKRPKAADATANINQRPSAVALTKSPANHLVDGNMTPALALPKPIRKVAVPRHETSALQLSNHGRQYIGALVQLACRIAQCLASGYRGFTQVALVAGFGEEPTNTF